MIGVYLHHHGSGHRVRGSLVAAAVVAAGVPVTGLGTGGAPRNWPGAWVELVADDDLVEAHSGAGWDAHPGGGPTHPVTGDPTAGGVLHWAPLGDPAIARRQRQVVEWLDTARPSVVLVDVSVEIALQVRLCGIPVVVTALPGDRTDRPHRTAYDLAEHLLAPWPQDTHDRGWPEHWRAKAWHVGAISRFADRAAVPVPARTEPGQGAGGVPAGRPAAPTRTVLCVWGGGGAAVGPGRLEATQAATPGWTWVHRGGRHAPSPDLWAELTRADVVVTHGGQNAVADVACAGRPSVVVAQPRPHGEQEATAAAVERLGAARGLVGWPAADRWPDLLADALRRGGEGWRRWRSPDAAQRAAQLLTAAHQARRTRPAA